jgi:4-amino-4-deoxy-L-arabinose transferase-like glycosyltransferase
MTAALQLDLSAARERGSRRQRIALESTFLVLLIAAAFLLRIWAMSEARFWDETVYLQNADVICCAKANYSELDSRPPLLSIVFAAAFLLWHHVYAASIAAALLNALAPAFLYFSGRAIAGRVPAAIAALLLAFSPFFVGVFPSGFVSDDTGNSLLSDSPALTLIVLAFWLLLRALRQQTGQRSAYGRFACAGFVLALAVLMRFASLSSVGVLLLLVFLADRWWSAAVACAAGLAAGIAPYLCWSRWRYGGFFRTFRNGWGYFEGPGESRLFYLKNFANIFSWIALAGLALWIGEWAWQKWQNKVADRRAGAVERPAEQRTLDQRSRKLEAFLWLWAVALLIFFSALRHKEPRYAMPLAPPLFLLAGIGLSVLLKGRRKVRRTTTRLAGAAILAAALVYTFLPVRQRFDAPFVDDAVSEEMQVSDFLTHTLPPSTVLYSNFNYPVFAWYTNLRVVRLPESGAALYDQLDHLPSDGILIVYKANDEIQDPRLDWLDRDPHFRRLREFPSIILYEYRVCPDLASCYNR